MTRSKIVAIVTGAVSLLIAIAYLVLVQVLDFRGGMLPAPPVGMASAAMEAIGPSSLTRHQR
jgi:hypothetical protein